MLESILSIEQQNFQTFAFVINQKLVSPALELAFKEEIVSNKFVLVLDAVWRLFLRD